MHDPLSLELRRLLTGLVDQEIKRGESFMYDGSKLFADEVATLLLPSVVCLAQDVASRVGLGDFGYKFSLEAVKPGLPLKGVRDADAAAMFMEVAPFIAEVFEGEVMDSRHDIVRVFEAAVRTFRPDFSLEQNTNYNALTA
jgi:hypothetical protein